MEFGDVVMLSSWVKGVDVLEQCRLLPCQTLKCASLLKFGDHTSLQSMCLRQRGANCWLVFSRVYVNDSGKIPDISRRFS